MENPKEFASKRSWAQMVTEAKEENLCRRVACLVSGPPENFRIRLLGVPFQHTHIEGGEGTKEKMGSNFENYFSPLFSAICTEKALGVTKAVNLTVSILTESPRPIKPLILPVSI